MPDNEEIRIKKGIRIKWRDKRESSSNMYDLGEITSIRESSIDKGEYWIETDKGYDIHIQMW